MKRIALSASLLALLFLSGCSFKKVGDFFLEPARAPQPVALKQIDNRLSAHMNWTQYYAPLNGADAEGLGAAENERYVFLGMPNGLVTAFYRSDKPSWDDQVAWQVKLPSPVLSGPVLANETLYVGTADGQLVAMNPADGTVRWQKQLSSSVDADMVVAGDRLLVRTLDSKLYAVRLNDGDILWQAEHEAPALALQGEPAVTVAGPRLFVAWENGLVEGLALENGAGLWQQRIATPKGRTDLERMVDIQARPHLYAGRLFVGGFHGKLAALDPASGQLYWVKDFSTYRDMALVAGKLIVVDDDDVLHAFDLITGTPVWQNSELKYRELTDLAVWHDKVVFGDEKGLLHVVDPTTGSLVGRYRHHSAPVVKVLSLGDDVYVIDGEGYLSQYRFQLTTHE